MLILSSVVAGSQLWDVVSIASALFGVMGSLFFAYELLGRPGGPLRWLLRLFMPTLLSVIMVSVLFALVFAVQGTLGLKSSHQVLGDAALFGALLGIYSGQFVGVPTGSLVHRVAWSARDAAFGFVLGVCVLGCWLLLQVAPGLFPLKLAAGGLVAAAAALLWHYTGRHRSVGGAPVLHSPVVGGIIGAAAGWALVFGILFVATIGPHGMRADTIGAVAIVALTVGLPAGAITGGLTQYTFGWANSLSDQGLQVLGLAFILVAFLAQIAQPLTHLLGL